MKKFVPLRKQSKRMQKEHHKKQRGSWYGVDPVTRSVPNKKVYSRCGMKIEANSEEW